MGNRLCPPTLLGQVRQALPRHSAAVPWFSRLRVIAEETIETSRGQLGYFSSTQMNSIERNFVTMGEPDPWWGSIINPLWAAHLTDVEEAWDHAADSNALHVHSLSNSTLVNGSTQASVRPVPEPPGKHGPDRPRKKFLVAPFYFALPSVPSVVVPTGATQ